MITFQQRFRIYKKNILTDFKLHAYSPLQLYFVFRPREARVYNITLPGAVQRNWGEIVELGKCFLFMGV